MDNQNRDQLKANYKLGQLVYWKVEYHAALSWLFLRVLKTCHKINVTITLRKSAANPQIITDRITENIPIKAKANNNPINIGITNQCLNASRIKDLGSALKERLITKPNSN